MKRFITLLLSVCMLALAGCAKYVSSYSAFLFIHGTHENGGEMSFAKLKGRYVFKLKAEFDGAEGCIAYTATVTEGEGMTVYYDGLGLKEELVVVNGADSISSRGGYIERGKTVYVIVETIGDESIAGSFSFELTDELA